MTFLARMDHTQEDLPVPDAIRGLSLLLLQLSEESILRVGAFHQEELRLDLEVGPEIGSSLRQVRCRR